MNHDNKVVLSVDNHTWMEMSLESLSDDIILNGYYTPLLNSEGGTEFSPLPKPHNSTATSPIYLSQASPLSIRKGDRYGPRIKKTVGVCSTCK